MPHVGEHFQGFSNRLNPVLHPFFRVKYDDPIFWFSWDSHSSFIIPYWKFVKSFSHPISIGMRFKMRCESEDASERRCTGLITGSPLTCEERVGPRVELL